jgi:nucleoside-triphosphatase
MLHAPDKKVTPSVSSLVLWVGRKHSGKTSGVARLVQIARADGFVVAGRLAPAVYANDLLLGFDIINLRSGERAVLARRETGPGADQKFHFTTEGLTLGNEALNPIATEDADLIIIDEYGPLELAFQGWRAATDRLMTSTGAVLLLVVRGALADEVQQLYQAAETRRLDATQPQSIDEVLALLRNNRP